MVTVPQGVCPNCRAQGALAEPCRERGCTRRGYRFIPAEHLGSGGGDVDAAIGRMLGKWLLVSRLGSGGFGTVYLAVQVPLVEMHAAVKVLHRQDDALVLEQLLAKFEGEARALARLGHPNVVRLHEYGRQDDSPYLVMEYVAEARTLKAEIKGRALRGEPFALDEVHRILRQTCDALGAAHRLGIVHRDVKPENIMLQDVEGDPSFVRVLDFGLVKFLGEDGPRSRVMGTPAYMAPEQLLKGELGPWTDLYALGAIAFELLTGRRAFAGRTDKEVLGKAPGLPTLREEAGLPGRCRGIGRPARRDARDGSLRTGLVNEARRPAELQGGSPGRRA